MHRNELDSPLGSSFSVHETRFMKPWMRMLAGALIAGTLLTALTACDQFQPDPVAFTRVGDTDIVRVCLPLTVKAVTISALSPDSPDDERIAFQSRGSTEFAAGAEFALRDLLEGHELIVDMDEYFDAAEELKVQLRVSNPQGGGWVTYTVFPAEALSEGVWLNGHGQTVEVPCVQAECSPGYACHNNWPQQTGAPTLPEPTYTPTPEVSPAP